MKKETIEVAADLWSIDTNNVHPADSYIAKAGFIEGAKWQAERMYSEEDLREAFKQSRQCKIFEKDLPPVYNEFDEWFKQFKKK